MRKNAALVVAFLCCFFYFMPWESIVPDAFYIHIMSILSSTIIVIFCAKLNRLSAWSIAIQTIESICVVWQSKIILNWDNQSDIFYILHDDFMMLAFGIELLFLATQTPIYRTLRDAISNTLRRAFLALVRVYPHNRGLHDTHYAKGNH